MFVNKMVRTEPFFRKCCFCISLQSCLQIWACIKLMTDIALFVFLSMLVLLLSNNQALSFKEFSLEHVFCLLIVMLFVDGVFMVFLSIGLCMNNVRSLKIFFYYSIYMVVTNATVLLGFNIYGALNWYHFGNEGLMISLIVCGIVNTGLDVAIILTLKSEIIKLRNKQQFEFATFKGEERTDLSQIEEERLYE